MNEEEIIIQAYRLCKEIEKQNKYRTSMSIMVDNESTFYLHRKKDLTIVFHTVLRDEKSIEKIQNFINYKQTA